MALKKQLRFVTLGVTAFAGIGPKSKVKIEYPEGFTIADEFKDIDKDNGLVIVFPHGYNYVELEGDQGVGKTSLIECLKEAAGGMANPNTEHATTDLDGKLQVDKKYGERFWGIDGNLYNLKVTKSTITLENVAVDEDGIPVLNAKGKEVASIMKTPKTLLQQIIGPAGISPMTLKAMNGSQQISWVKSLFNQDLEAQKMELEIKKNYDKAYKDRTAANNEYKRIDTILKENIFFKNYEHWQNYFDTVSYKELQAAIAYVTKNKEEYDLRKNGVPALELQRKPIQDDIEDLNEQIRILELKKKDKVDRLKVIEDKILEGKAYLEKNTSYLTDHEAMADKIKEATDFTAHKQSFEQMELLKKDLDKQADEKIRLDALVDKYAQLKKEYIKQFTPDIEDLEVCIKDEAEIREGLFYKGRTLAMLAESELWQLATQLWKAMNVKVIYVENVDSLGTGAVEKFNEFLTTDGAYIFATKMNRGEDNLKISFHNKIPV